jgi:hypothetical protein
MTAGRPMIVCGAVPGNEKVNEAFVVSRGAGVASAPHLVGANFMQLRAEGRLQSMALQARRAVRHNAASSIVRYAAELSMAVAA